MKKLFSSLIITPHIIAGCGGAGDYISGNSNRKILVFGKEYTQMEIDDLFENDGYKIKLMIDNAQADAVNSETGDLTFKKITSSSPVFSFENIDETNVVDLPLMESYHAFMTASKNTSPANLSSDWLNVIKTGQHRRNIPFESSLLYDWKEYDIDSILSKPLGLEDKNTIITLKGLTDFVPFLNGNSYAYELSATPEQSIRKLKTDVIFNNGSGGILSQFSSRRNIELSDYLNNSSDLQYKTFGTSGKFQYTDESWYHPDPYPDENFGGVVNNRILFQEGNDQPLTSSSPYVSWYLYGNGYHDEKTVGRQMAGDMQVNFGLFDQNGRLLEFIFALRMPHTWWEVNGSTFNHHYDNFLRNNLYKRLNSISEEAIWIKEPGSKIVLQGYSKGIGYMNLNDNKFLYSKHSDLISDLHIATSEERKLMAAFRSWLYINPTLIGATKKEVELTEYEWYWGNSSSNTTGVRDYKFTSKNTLYKYICVYGSNEYTKSTNKSPTWTCPTA